LGVEVDKKNTSVAFREGVAEIQAGGGLRYATFLVGDRDDGGHGKACVWYEKITRCVKIRVGVSFRRGGGSVVEE
jgi:hypothetical protein